jgi:hypothetical protein
MHSIINWISVKDRLPKLEKNVIIVCKNGYVGYGMIAIRPVYGRNKKTQLYERTDIKRLEWGQEENGFEYWEKIEDVILWAEFPEYPLQIYTT